MNTKLEQAMFAIQALPAEEQEAIATELLEEVSLLSHSGLNDHQRAIVAARLNAPFNFATPDEVERVMHKY